MTVSCKAWNSPVEYQSKHDAKESEGNMLDPIFKREMSRGGNIDGDVHLQNVNY